MDGLDRLTTLRLKDTRTIHDGIDPIEARFPYLRSCIRVEVDGKDTNSRKPALQRLRDANSCNDLVTGLHKAGEDVRTDEAVSTSQKNANRTTSASSCRPAMQRLQQRERRGTGFYTQTLIEDAEGMGFTEAAEMMKAKP
jgi:hypothetical protein